MSDTLKMNPTPFQQEFEIDGLYSADSIREKLLEHFPGVDYPEFDNDVDYSGFYGLKIVQNQFTRRPIRESRLRHNPREADWLIPEESAKFDSPFSHVEVPERILRIYEYTDKEAKKGLAMTEFEPTDKGYRAVKKCADEDTVRVYTGTHGCNTIIFTDDQNRVLWWDKDPDYEGEQERYLFSNGRDYGMTTLYETRCYSTDVNGYRNEMVVVGFKQDEDIPIEIFDTPKKPKGKIYSIQIETEIGRQEFEKRVANYRQAADKKNKEIAELEIKVTKAKGKLAEETKARASLTELLQ